ncbi:Glycolate dehydrogenase, iron-sulfur subunit GlcF, partial [Candidatus Burkholderia humilis]
AAADRQARPQDADAHRLRATRDDAQRQHRDAARVRCARHRGRERAGCGLRRRDPAASRLQRRSARRCAQQHRRMVAVCAERRRGDRDERVGLRRDGKGIRASDAQRSEVRGEGAEDRRYDVQSRRNPARVRGRTDRARATARRAYGRLPSAVHVAARPADSRAHRAFADGARAGSAASGRQSLVLRIGGHVFGVAAEALIHAAQSEARPAGKDRTADDRVGECRVYRAFAERHVDACHALDSAAGAYDLRLSEFV